MKIRLQELIRTYTDMLVKERSKLRRAVLENIIADLEQVLREAQ